MGDPIQDYLDQQRRNEEAALMNQLRKKHAQIMKDHYDQVPEGRLDMPPPSAAEERFPGDYPDEIGGWRLS